MKSPVRWLTNEEYENASPKEKFVAWADSQVGVREVGRNAGERVRAFLASVGLPVGYAWCAAFVSWSLKQAGLSLGPKRGRAAVRNWRDWAVVAGRITKEPERGDLFYLMHNRAQGHIGIFLRWLDGKEGRMFMSIEGNTNIGGSREGDGVYKRNRHAAGVQFIKV